MKTTTVYLLHFDQPYVSGKAQVQHYIGSTNNLGQRLERHENKLGSKLVAAVVSAGITFQPVRTWAGDRTTERKLKQQKNAKRYCPICSPK